VSVVPSMSRHCCRESRGQSDVRVISSARVMPSMSNVVPMASV